MHVERALICKIISTGRLDEAISKGVREDLFVDDECREMFAYIVAHARKYKSPPSSLAVKQEKPDFEWEHVQDPIEYVCDQFANLVRKRYAQDAAEELARALDDPERVQNIELEFLEASRKLATIVPTSKVARFKDMDRRIEEYEERAKNRDKIGIPFGFPILDQWTGGIQPHEFAVVAAFSSLGKSTLLRVVAFNAWMNNKTPLFISLEMEADTILRKFDAMAASLDYQKMKQLELPSEQLRNWRQKAKEIRETVHDIPVIDDIRHCTPDVVFAETVRHKPDLVVVDYLSLMRSSSPSRGVSLWQSLTEITQDLKQIARTLKIPILAAAQTNRSGAKDGAELDNVGYSISVTQDPDLVIGLFADEDMLAEKEMEIRLIKNRDGRRGQFRAIWDHENSVYREKNARENYYRQRPPAATNGKASSLRSSKIKRVRGPRPGAS